MATDGSQAQVRGGAHASGQPIFGVDSRPEVGADGAHDHRGRSRHHTDQQLAHPHILAHGCPLNRFGAANQQVARYR